MGLEDIRAFQVHLVSQGVSWASLNQTVCALRFFYGVTLDDRAEIPARIVYAHTPRKLPTILSAAAFLAPFPNDAQVGVDKRFMPPECQARPSGIARSGHDRDGWRRVPNPARSGSYST